MKDSLTQNLSVATFRKNRVWFFIWGIVLLILGLIAISSATLTTLISVIFFGVLIFIGSLIVIIDTFTFWWAQWKGFFLHLIMGILYFVIGLTLIKNPVLASMSLTLLLGILYFVLGIFRIVYSLYLSSPRWKWNLLNGIISCVLGFLIMMSWPASSLYIIGLFIGIDLLFSGIAYIMTSFLPVPVMRRQ